MSSKGYQISQRPDDYYSTYSGKSRRIIDYDDDIYPIIVDKSSKKTKEQA